MKKLTIIFLLISSLSFAITLSLKNYQCDKCATVIKSENSPNALHCPKGSTHNWHSLGDVGDKNYQCKYCGTVVPSEYSPNALHCPNGGNHDWSKL